MKKSDKLNKQKNYLKSYKTFLPFVTTYPTFPK